MWGGECMAAAATQRVHFKEARGGDNDWHEWDECSIKE